MCVVRDNQEKTLGEKSYGAGNLFGKLAGNSYTPIPNSDGGRFFGVLGPVSAAAEAAKASAALAQSKSAAPASVAGTAPLQTTDLSYSSGINRKPIYSSTISQGKQSAKFGD